MRQTIKLAANGNYLDILNANDEIVISIEMDERIIRPTDDDTVVIRRSTGEDIYGIFWRTATADGVPFQSNSDVINWINTNVRAGGVDSGGGDSGGVDTEVTPLFTAVSGLTSVTTTGSFKNIGDPNPLFTNEDGAVVWFEFGDSRRSDFTFIDGIASQERRGTSTADMEVTIINGQIAVRDIGSSSTIVKSWYERPKS